MANVPERQTQQPAPHLTGEFASASSPPGPPRRNQHRVPTWLSVVLVVLTCMSFLATTLTLWTEATLLNTDRFVAAVGPLGDDPQVIESVSTYVADQAVAALNIPGRTASALPANGQFLSGPLEQTVHDFVQTRTATLLTSDKMQATWETMNRSIHAELVAALRGQPSTVTIADGALSANLLPLIAETLRSLQQSAPSFIPSGPPIPDLAGIQPPTEQRQMLAQALGIQLAPDFGVVTLPHNDALVTAQRIVTTLDTLRIVLPIATLALAIATIWTAADQRRAWLLLGIGTAAPTLVAILLIWLLRDRATAAATAGPAQTIAAVVVESLSANLLALLAGILMVSILVALAAHLAGKPKWLTRLRAGNSRYPANGAAL